MEDLDRPSDEKLDADRTELDLMSNFEKIRLGISGLRTVLDKDLAAVSLSRIPNVPQSLKDAQYPMLILFKDEALLDRLEKVTDSGSMARLTQIHQDHGWAEAVNKIYDEATYEEKILACINFLARHLDSTVPILYHASIPYYCVVALKNDTLFEFLMAPPPKEV
jgi:hypothetical protein